MASLTSLGSALPDQSCRTESVKHDAQFQIYVVSPDEISRVGHNSPFD
jgi:hypothetical protein